MLSLCIKCLGFRDLIPYFVSRLRCHAMFHVYDNQSRNRVLITLGVETYVISFVMTTSLECNPDRAIIGRSSRLKKQSTMPLPPEFPWRTLLVWREYHHV